MAEVKRCFEVDDPAQTTLTTFTKVDANNVSPGYVNPDGISPASSLLVGDIYFAPQTAQAVMQCIQSQWRSHNDAEFVQFIGGSQQRAIVLGYSYFPNAIPNQDLIKIFVAE